MNLDALVSFGVIVLFVVWFYGPWQETCIDYARQIIFEQRDKIFDLADSGEMNFNSKEYKQLRAALNAAIRFAHELTIARMIFSYVYSKSYRIENNSRGTMQDYVGVDVEVRNKIAEVRNKAFGAMIASMLARSLVFVSLCIVLSPFVIIGVMMYFWWVGFSMTIAKIKRRATRFIGNLVQIEADYEDRMSSVY